MKISRGNTISHIGKTFWRYCYILYHILYHSIYVLHLPHNIKDTTWGLISSLIYYIWHRRIRLFLQQRMPSVLLMHIAVQQISRSSFSATWIRPLANSTEHLILERKAARWILEAGPILRVLKYLSKGIAFVLQLQTARPSRGSDEHVKCLSCLQYKRREIY